MAYQPGLYGLQEAVVEERTLSFIGVDIQRVGHFRYLRLVLDETGHVDLEHATNRIQAKWKNWKAVTGILCDRIVPVRLKCKMYKTVVRQRN